MQVVKKGLQVIIVEPRRNSGLEWDIEPRKKMVFPSLLKDSRGGQNLTLSRFCVKESCINLEMLLKTKEKVYLTKKP